MTTEHSLASRIDITTYCRLSLFSLGLYRPSKAVFGNWQSTKRFCITCGVSIIFVFFAFPLFFIACLCLFRASCLVFVLSFLVIRRYDMMFILNLHLNHPHNTYHSLTPTYPHNFPYRSIPPNYLALRLPPSPNLSSRLSSLSLW